MVVLWWLFFTSKFPFDYIAQYSDGVKRKGYQGIRAIETFECENTTSDFEC